MRLHSFLLVSILFANLGNAYTVILLSGKQLNGNLLGEDSKTIQLRDVTGVVLSIKKSGVDAEATLHANIPVHTQEPVIIKNAPAPPPQKNVVELARDLRAARTGNSRLYTRDDLKTVPEVSTGSEPDTLPDQSSGAGGTPAVQNDDEAYWRKAASSFRKELAKLRERKISAEFSCEKAREKRSAQIYGSNRRPSDLSQAFEQTPECKRFDEIQSQLSDVLWRWDEFTERARRSGIPWSWIE